VSETTFQTPEQKQAELNVKERRLLDRDKTALELERGQLEGAAWQKKQLEGRGLKPVEKK
jgi:hypothetical protein